MYVSKLVYNSNEWTSPTGLASNGITLNNGEVYGFEEWLNNSILKKLKIGFLESFRKRKGTEKIGRIALITFCKRTRTVYYVGNLYDVTQITNNQIPLKRQLLPEDWLDIISADLTRQFPNTNANELYLQCYNSNIISGPIGGSFVFNIKYENLELFPREKWINLTKLNPEVNKRWRRIIHLYNVPNELELIF